MYKKEVTVALAGNPNVGKSTIFNELTGLKQHTGNWTGKTVDLASGKTEKDGIVFNFIDIPGTYSLKPHSKEESVAGDFICFGGAEKVVVVCDATNLERNLYLVLQIIETGADTTVCVNLLDEARKKGIILNLPLLEKELGVKVVGTSACEGKGIDELLRTLLTENQRNSINLKYPQEIETALEYIFPCVRKCGMESINSRWLGLRLLENDETAKEFVLNNKALSDSQKEDVLISANRGREYLRSNSEECDVGEIISSALYKEASRIAGNVTIHKGIEAKISRGENVFTKRASAYLVMLAMLSLVFYITIVGANYPSQWLSIFFSWAETQLLNISKNINIPVFIQGMVISGGFRVLGWVVSVMLPPMAIFFPCFTLLEDFGFLPRVSYVLDNSFGKAKTCGKQALTTCMGYGCNCVGIAGARIIDSKRERLIAILTNTLTPCNGRFPAIIKLISVFLVAGTGFGKGFLNALILALIIVLSLALTLFVSNILSKTLLKGEPSHYILELPPYRKPQISKVIVNSILNRTVLVLFRAVVVAFPAGIVIWLLANISIGNSESILELVNKLLEPLGNAMGLDGKILSAFFLGVPANEIVLPIALMSYLGTGEISSIENTEVIGEILKLNGWTSLTAVCYILFSVVHFPCATALLTIFKETKSVKWTVLSFVMPTILGIVLCCVINLFGKL